MGCGGYKNKVLFSCMSEVFQKSQPSSPNILPAQREGGYTKQTRTGFCSQPPYHEKRSQGTELTLDSGPTLLHTSPHSAQLASKVSVSLEGKPD